MKNSRKSLIIIILIAVAIVSIVGLAIAVMLDTAKPQPPIEQIEYINVMYSIDEKCGRIEGKYNQYILKGEDSEPITVIPNLGYIFVGWADVNDQDVVFDTEKITRQEISVQQNLWLIAKFIGPVNSDVVFAAGYGGAVEGKLEQSVLYGGKGERVVAIPYDGYRFVKWSDGETEAIRENTSLCYLADSRYYIYAEFERYSRTYEFVYNDGISVTGEKEIEITLDNIDKLVFPVPERENCKFEGWYSDWHQEIQVADENGEMLVGAEWLQNEGLYYIKEDPEGYLYAKWKTTNELPTYKILMIYITEVHGDFVYLDENEELVELRIDYVMTEKHRKICNLLTEFMSKYLNSIFNETVRFQVDEYFTSEPVSSNEFACTPGYIYEPDMHSSNRGIPEIRELIKEGEYGSYITSYSLCGYENDFALTRNLGGSVEAGKNFACVVLDHVLNTFNDIDLDDLTNYYSLRDLFFLWEGALITYVHEFIHTVEHTVGIKDNVGLHSALSYGSKNHGDGYPYPYHIFIPFLLNKFEGDGEYWGIPYEYWVIYGN